MLSSIIVPTAYCGDEYRITGTVVDDMGNPVEGVKVSVYSDFEADIEGQSYGYFVTKDTTDEEGRYSIPVDRGSYNLVYTKKGYNTETQSVEFNSVFKVNLKELTIHNSLTISLQNGTRVVKPGQLLEIPFTVQNTGESPTQTGFRVDAGGWDAEIMDTVGEISSTGIESGSTVSLTLRLMVPYEPGETRDVNLLVKSTVNITCSVGVVIDDEPQNMMSCPFKSLQCPPGGVAEYRVELTNPFYYTLETELTLEGLPEDWSYRILHEETGVTSVSLDHGETVNLVIMVNSDNNAEQRVYDLTFSASHRDGSEELPLSLRVAENMEPVYISTKYPDQSVEIGDSITYSITIENPTTESETLSLSVDSLPEDWRAEFMNTEGLKVGSVHLEPDSSETLRIKITPRLESSLGEYSLVIGAEAESLRGSLQLNINLVGSQDGVMTLSSLYEKLTVGESKTITVKITNTGYSDLTNVVLNVESSSETIQTEVEPYRVNTIKPGESATMMLKVRATEGTSTGDYVLTLKAVSNEYSFDVKQIRVTLKLGNRMLYISGGLLLLGVGSLVLVLKLIRRK